MIIMSYIVPQKYFKIEFLNSNVFAPRDVIVGQLNISFTKPKCVRAIYVDIHGDAKTHLTRSRFQITDLRRRHLRMRSRIYRSTETYANARLLLWGSNSADYANVIPAGQLILPFTFTLPDNCPPSFDGRNRCFDGGKYGNICYYCEATIERPGVFNRNKKITAAFRVSRRINDAEFRVHQPLTIEETAAVGIFWIGGYVSMIVHIPKRVFVIGETVPINCQLNNASKHRVNRIIVSLVEHIRYTAERANLLGNHVYSRMQMRTVYSCSDALSVEANASNHYSRSFVIPSALESIFNCEIIIVEYKLHVEVITNALFSRSVCVDLPIVINGSSNTTNRQQQLNSRVQPTAPHLPSLWNTIPSVDPNQPPPSYEECVHRRNMFDNDANRLYRKERL